MSIRRWLSVTATAALVAAGLLVAGATPASADQVWIQAFERPSADSPCTPPTDETPWQESFTGQQDWAPSWAEWANGGQGGWVCERYIIWAKDTPPPPSASVGPGCVQASSAEYFNFVTGSILTDYPMLYSDADCTAEEGATFYFAVVYAPDGVEQAEALCQTVDGRNAVFTVEDYGVWGCAFD